MERDRIIERIRKLLRLSHSENPYEAALAAERVQRMLSEYNLTLEGIVDEEMEKARQIRGCPACFLILKGVVISSHETNRFS